MTNTIGVALWTILTNMLEWKRWKRMETMGVLAMTDLKISSSDLKRGVTNDSEMNSEYLVVIECLYGMHLPNSFNIALYSCASLCFLCRVSGCRVRVYRLGILVAVSIWKALTHLTAS